MAHLPIKNFLGLRSGVSDPEVGGAGVANNFRRNRVRGQLEFVDSFATRLTFSPTTYGVSSLTPIAMKSFYVADQGGRTVTAVVAKYTKTPLGFAGGTPVSTSGVWVRPWFDGSNWQDSWLELTEFQILRYASSVGSVITVDEETQDWPSTNYYAGWVLLRQNLLSGSASTGIRVVSSSDADLTVVGDAADLSGWSAGDLVYAYRSVLGKSMPSFAPTAYPHLRGVLDELRVTTGNAATDLDLAAFYRDKTLFNGISFERNGVLAEYGQLNVPALAFKMRNPVAVSAPGSGFPQGEYDFRMSMTMDDGQETELREVLIGQFPHALSFTSDTALGASAKYIATDGSVSYVVSSKSGSNMLWKVAADGEVLSFLSIPDTEGMPIGVHCAGGAVYIALWNVGGGTIKVNRYSAGLAVLATGSTALSYGSGYGIAGFSASYAFLFIQSSDRSTYIIHRVPLSTLSPDKFRPNTSLSFTAHSVVASDTFFMVTGNTACLKCSPDIDNVAPQNVYSSMGSTATTVGTFVGSVAYIGTGTRIVKVTNAGSYQDHSTGHDAAGWYGMWLDGSILYGLNGHILKKMATGESTTYVSYTDTSADVARNLVAFGANVFAVTDNGYVRRFTTIAQGATLNANGNVYPKFDILVSPGLVPVRAAALNLYVSKDGGAWYLLKTLSLLSSGITFEAASIFDSTVNHRYYVALNQSFTGADYAAATSTAISRLGRDEFDAGVYPYSFAITANSRTYAAGVRVGDRVSKNRVYTSPATADGVPQYDVLPNDASTILDVEFNDGDSIVALGSVADRILVLRSRSLVLLTPNSDGSHSRDVVSTGIGVSAPRSIVSFNEALYWLDHSGVKMFTTGGITEISGAIDPLLFALTDAQREAAIACVDPKNMQYRLLINGVIYVYDIRDGEWTTETGSSQIWFDSDLGFGTGAGSGSNAPSAKRYSQLVAAGIQVPTENTFVGTAEWETSRIETPDSYGYDTLMSALYIDYISTGSTAITLKLYLNDEVSEVKSYTLPVGSYEVTVPAPLTARCKWFRVKVSAVSSGSGATVKIRRMGAYFNKILVGGDGAQA